MFRKIVLLIVFTFNIVLAQEYELGEGYNIPNTPVYLGGYTTIDYAHRKDGYKRLRLDELALLSYGAYDRFSYMASIGLKEGYVQHWDTQNSRTTNTKLNIERLYIDYQYNDTLQVRLGKYNTPVGYWNMEPINVMQDTTSIPYSSYLIFPRYSTGVQFHYANEFQSNTSYTLGLQQTKDLDDKYNNITVDSHYLLGVEQNFGMDLHLKGNVGYFNGYDYSLNQYRKFLYSMISLKYEGEQFDLLGELGNRYDATKKLTTVPYALYLQGAYHITPKHGVVYRFETYKIDEGASRDEYINVLGYVYRPTFPFTFKIEYRDHSYQNETQIQSSVSMMF